MKSGPAVGDGHNSMKVAPAMRVLSGGGRFAKGLGLILQENGRRNGRGKD
jgi:hypothetical protein